MLKAEITSPGTFEQNGARPRIRRRKFGSLAMQPHRRHQNCEGCIAHRPSSVRVFQVDVGELISDLRLDYRITRMVKRYTECIDEDGCVPRPDLARIASPR